MKLTDHKLDLGYPLYGARFVNSNTVIVAGGGGDGNNGIPNKMTAILIQPTNAKKPIKRYRELVLNENEDSVMSLDVGNGIILAGINENQAMMSRGINKHLRKFKFENDHLKFVESVQIHPNANSMIYQKITAISNDGTTGVIVMSDSPSSIYIVDSLHELEEKFKIVTEGDVKDITISQDGKLMCYITSNIFEVISLVTGRSVFKKNLTFAMSKVRFLDNNEVIISGSKNSNTHIAKFSISKSSIIQERMVLKNIKGITAMDVNIANNLIVLATSNYSLVLLRTSDLKIVKILNKVHEFAITKTVFSENGEYLVSTSAANTIDVVEIPPKFADSKSMISTIFHYIGSIILIVLMGIVLQYLQTNGYLDVAKGKVMDIYNGYKPQDSSAYFKVEDGFSFDEDTVISSIADVEKTVEDSTETQVFISEPIETTDVVEDLKKVTVDEDFITQTTQLTADVTTTDSFLDNTVVEQSSESTKTVSTEVSDVDEETETETQTHYETYYETSFESSVSEPIATTIETGVSVTESIEEVTGTTSVETVETEVADVIESTESIATEVPEVTEIPEVTETAEPVETETTKVIETAPVETEIIETEETVEPVEEPTIESIEPTPIPIVTETKEIEITKEVEVTKEIEITKEVTSIVLSTETSTSIQIATAIATFTSTALFTSIETSTSIQTATAFAIETSVVVVTKELIVESTVTLQVMPTVDVKEDFGIQIEPESEVFDNAEEGSKKLADDVVEELENIVNIQIEPETEIFDDAEEGNEAAEEQAIKELEDIVGIQIEPEHEVFGDAAEGSARADEQVVEELQDIVNIQIEPETEVFENAQEGAEREAEKVVEELESTIEVQIEPETEVFEDAQEGIERADEQAVEELEDIQITTTSTIERTVHVQLSSSIGSTTSKLVISSITPIALFETEPETALVRDEL